MKVWIDCDERWPEYIIHHSQPEGRMLYWENIYVPAKYINEYEEAQKAFNKATEQLKKYLKSRIRE